jgi:hypothetical protein
VLPDDDMRCTIKTCGSSGSVLMCIILDHYMMYNSCICWCAILSELLPTALLTNAVFFLLTGGTDDADSCRDYIAYVMN